VIVPARPADLDVGGAAKVYDLIEDAVRELNPGLEVLGVLVVQTQRRWVLRRETHHSIEAQGMRALPVEVPFSVRVGAAPRFGAPTFVLEPDGRVAHAYRRLATHLVRSGAPVEAAA
jgi:cellulose biosynthesis protein BcsQ